MPSKGVGHRNSKRKAQRNQANHEARVTGVGGLHSLNYSRRVGTPYLIRRKVEHNVEHNVLEQRYLGVSRPQTLGDAHVEAGGVWQGHKSTGLGGAVLRLE